MKSSFHGLIFFLLFLLNRLRLPSAELDPILDNNSLKRPSLSLYKPSARTTQKTQPVCCEGCLLIRCLAMDVLLREYACAGICLPSRCLETGCITPLFYCCGRYTAPAAVYIVTVYQRVQTPQYTSSHNCKATFETPYIKEYLNSRS
jgi:hypothetical protein